jgi:hypothetical protein
MLESFVRYLKTDSTYTEPSSLSLNVFFLHVKTRTKNDHQKRLTINYYPNTRFEITNDYLKIIVIFLRYSMYKNESRFYSQNRFLFAESFFIRFLLIDS